MRIALYTNSRVPAQRYGGTQRVVTWLARGLAEHGHEVILLAERGSVLPEARVIPLPGADLRRPSFKIDLHLPPGVDILHVHGLLPGSTTCPTVKTLHGNRPPGSSASTNTICLSADHATRHGTTAFVYNGLDLREYRFAATKDRYDLFLGRLHASKGHRWAVAGARQAGRRLLIAGAWRPSLRRSLRYVGSVGGERKAALLAGAQCLWMPALWDEPFGLTLIEALASGTPVLGTRRGALPEIVTPAVGALGDTLEELVELRSTMDHLDAAACRSRVEEKFTHLVMAESYVRMYRHFLATGRLPPGHG